MRKILLVIDLQPDFAVEPYYHNIINYIETNKHNYDIIMATRFINYEDSPFIQKLGYDGAMTKTNLEFTYDSLFSKHSYECGEGFYKHIKDDEIFVVGCDTDACILAVCYEMFRLNMNFHVLADYCYSSGGEDFHNIALDLIERNFGYDALIEEGNVENE